jgi:hypothetical protein
MSRTATLVSLSIWACSLILGVRSLVVLSSVPVTAPHAQGPVLASVGGAE